MTTQTYRRQYVSGTRNLQRLQVSGQRQDILGLSKPFIHEQPDCMSKMTGLSDDVYRSVGKSHSVDERCIQTCLKTNVVSQYGLYLMRKY